MTDDPLLKRLPAGRAKCRSWPTGNVDGHALRDEGREIRFERPFRVALFRADTGVLLQVEQVHSATERVRIELWADGDQLRAIRAVLGSSRRPDAASKIDQRALLDVISALREPLAAHGPEAWQPPGGDLAPRSLLGDVDLAPLEQTGLPARLEDDALKVLGPGPRSFNSTPAKLSYAAGGLAYFAGAVAGIPWLAAAMFIVACVLFTFGSRRQPREIAITPDALTSTITSIPLPREGVGWILPPSLVFDGPVTVSHDGRPMAVLPGFPFAQGDVFATAIAEAWSLPKLPKPVATGTPAGMSANTERGLVAYLLRLGRDELGVDLSAIPIAMERIQSAADKAIAELRSVERTEVNLPFIHANENGPLHLQTNLDRHLLAELESPSEDDVRDPRLPGWVPRLDPTDLRVWLIGESVVIEGLFFDQTGTFLRLPNDATFPVRGAVTKMVGSGQYRRLRLSADGANWAFGHTSSAHDRLDRLRAAVDAVVRGIR